MQKLRKTLGRKSEWELRKRIKELNRIGIALTSEHNLKALLHLILKELRTFTNAEGGTLYTREKNILKFALIQNDALKEEITKNSFELPPIVISERSIAGYVAKTGEILNIEDVYKIPSSVKYHFNKKFDKRFKYRTKSMLTLPMKDHQDEIIGVVQLINFLSPKGEVMPFPKEEEEFVLSLASQAAMAIRNAKLIEQIKKVFGELVEYSISAIDARSPFTAGHSRRVAHYSLAIAHAINNKDEGVFAEVKLSEDELEELYYSAWLHDIGKLGVKEKVLEKSTKLSKEKIEAITERFNYIRLSLTIENLEKNSKFLFEEEDREEVLRNWAAKIDIEKELDEMLNFIKTLNSSNFATDKDIEYLNTIGEKTFIDRGKERPYLTETEHKHLSVRKGNLVKEEYEHIKTHTIHTRNILQKLSFPTYLENLPRFASAHHELLNGEGYPEGLKAEQIPLQVRILTVADIWDALTSFDRPYRKAFSIEEAVQILRKEAEQGRLDKDIVELYIKERLWEINFQSAHSHNSTNTQLLS